MISFPKKIIFKCVALCVVPTFVVHLPIGDRPSRDLDSGRKPRLHSLRGRCHAYISEGHVLSASWHMEVLFVNPLSTRGVTCRGGRGNREGG